MRIDLHTHSDVSDGLLPPAELVRLAAATGLSVLALTDHDTTGGWAAARAALPAGLTLVPGIELSCRVPGPATDDAGSLHMLGYWLDPADPVVVAETGRLRDDRVERARAIVGKLNALGAPVRWERVAELAGGEVVGRPHIARAMVEAGVVAERADAFTDEWIGSGGRAQVARYALDPQYAVRMLRAAGGVAVLAHPRAERHGETITDALIERLAAAGLAGIEVDHPAHDADDRAHLRGLADRLDLVPTGSSDFHGESTDLGLGAETTDAAAYRRLLDRRMA